MPLVSIPHSIPGPGGRPSVLIVDDEEAIRNLLSTIVQRLGGAPVMVASSAEARAVLPDHDWDCVIVDKNLPDGSGMKLLANVREAHPRAAVLVITAFANTESAIQAVRLGAFDYVVKPFDVATISYRIRQALERRQMERQLENAQEDLRRANAQLAESREEVKRAYLETVIHLSRVAESATKMDHVARVSRYAGILARSLSATDAWIETLVQAAPLHDIGMVGVPESILSKPGPLTADERNRMQEHVELGAEILAGATSNVLVTARDIILHHHERWNGHGYPRGLTGPAIPLAARVVAVADAWEALTSDRPWRPAMSKDEALNEMQAQSGRAFDPTIVDALCDVVPLLMAAR